MGLCFFKFSFGFQIEGRKQKAEAASDWGHFHIIYTSVLTDCFLTLQGRWSVEADVWVAFGENAKRLTTQEVCPESGTPYTKFGVT